MPTPSILIVPARFKSGKLYSQIPTSGAGDFTVTRATAATRVNASGLIESVASGIPRLDYFASGGTVGCPALLVEPSAQNLVQRSEEFDDAYWTKTNTTASGNVGIAPNGTTTAELLTPNTTGSNRIIERSFVGSLTSGAVYTQSFFVKASGFQWVAVDGINGVAGAWFDLINGVVGTVAAGNTASIQSFGNGWYRCSVTRTAASTIGFVVLRLADANGSVTATASGSNGVLIWGAQLETGSVATSYIPTTTGSVTRNADVVSVSGAVSGSIGQTEGTIYWEGAINRIDRVFFALSSGTSTTQAVRLQTTGAGLLQGIAISGTVQGNPSTSGAVTLGQFYKVAFAYKANDFVLYVNGVLQATDTSGTLPTNLNSVYFCNSNGTEITDQRCRAAALYTTRLTNAQLASLTSP